MMTLVRDVPMSECSWLLRDFAKGERVHRYHGCTYGCIGDDGIACSADGKPPFFELPADSLIEHQLDSASSGTSSDAVASTPNLNPEGQQ